MNLWANLQSIQWDAKLSLLLRIFRPVFPDEFTAEFNDVSVLLEQE